MGRRCCLKCGEEVDEFGHHGLHCPFGGDVIRSHNALADVWCQFFKRAGYVAEREQNYDIDRLIELESGRGCKLNADEFAVNGVPGDIKVYGWFDDGRAAYFDVIVTNVFAASHVKKASKKRLAAADEREKCKKRKYGQNDQIIPLVFESMGVMGRASKPVLIQLAEAIGLRRQTPVTVFINQLRTRLVAVLMQHNAQMVLSSIKL